MSDFNFVEESLPETDRELFFGPLEIGEYFHRFDKSWLMAHVMYKAGIFISISQARKNGWDKPIPKGFSEYIIGKLKHKITILNFW